MVVDGATAAQAREPQYPHEVLEAYVRERLGRLVDVFGEDADKMFRPLTLGLTEQLSVYCDLVSGARLKLGEVTVREGGKRTYIMAHLTDRGGPLRMRDATAHFEGDYDGDWVNKFVDGVNARRWRFVERYLNSFLTPLLSRVRDTVITYYERRPHAKPNVGMLRFLEGVDSTLLCIEIDDRGVAAIDEAGTKDSPERYRVE